MSHGNSHFGRRQLSTTLILTARYDIYSQMEIPNFEHFKDMSSPEAVYITKNPYICQGGCPQAHLKLGKLASPKEDTGLADLPALEPHGLEDAPGHIGCNVLREWTGGPGACRCPCLMPTEWHSAVQMACAWRMLFCHLKSSRSGSSSMSSETCSAWQKAEAAQKEHPC